jgi:hypothetical protein
MINDQSDNISIYNGSESHLNEDFGISLQNSQMKNNSPPIKDRSGFDDLDLFEKN